MIEDRLRAAFTALADTVDTPPPGLRQPTHRARAVVGAAAAVLIVGGGVWVAVQPSQPGSGPAPTAPPAASSSVTPPPPVTIPYELYTHCGIDEAKVGDSFYEADPPIPEPLDGWGNPMQTGTMTLVSPTVVVFRDDLGHVVQFRLRPGAKEFKHICQ